tara:strand:- start:14733 stop:15848 length:1116 start_codon:yes stop_codon:yes gene_type:complete
LCICGCILQFYLLKNHLKISIILPIKDTAKYLKTCLDSILSQTYQNWELLAVDDDSSDDCFSILVEYAKIDSRITALKNPNPGLLNALRFGYSHSTGELIHRMDSDDVMPGDKLEVMLASISATLDGRSTTLDVRLTALDGHNEAFKKGALITGATEYFSDEGPIGDGFKRYDRWLMEVAKNQSYREEVYKECVIPSNCWLVHRDDFDKIGAFDSDTFPEDYDLCFRFIAGGLKIIGLPKVLHHWRDRNDRISRTWEVYKDNRFFELKAHYFFKMDRDKKRPLVLWGAGKNGKDLAKFILKEEENLIWVCDNDNKIGKDIYGVKMQHFSSIERLNSPQIIIAVASPDGQREVKRELNVLNYLKGKDYWFFA